MMARKRAKEKRKPDRTVLQMTASQARAFLLKAECYCNVDLPVYFTFGRLLAAVSKEVMGKSLAGMSSKPREHENVNYSMLSNKDGRHAWRPLQLMHPALYVSLVDQLTTSANWTLIRKRFGEFQKASHIQCLSIPIQEATGGKDKAAQILNWWQGIEQRSLELALDYNHSFHADITDCYSAIYTHSIAWAVHTKPVAKSNKNDRSMIGNVIDS